MRALGGRRWQACTCGLCGGGAGAAAFFWMRAGKHNFAEVAVYAVILGLLLGWRLVHAGWRRRQAAQTAR